VEIQAFECWMESNQSNRLDSMTILNYNYNYNHANVTKYTPRR